MTTTQFDSLRYAKSGDAFKERLAAAGGAILADDHGAMFRDQTAGYRCLFTMPDGQTWRRVRTVRVLLLRAWQLSTVVRLAE